MSLTDPLAAYRLGPVSEAEDLETHLAPKDGEVLQRWQRGGVPIVLTERALLFADDGTGYRVAKGEVTSFGLTRASSTRMLRWGLGLYLGGLIPLFLGMPILTLAMAIAGAVLVTRGFLNKNILVQVDDDRVPPFVLENSRWRSLRKALRMWRAT